MANYTCTLNYDGTNVIPQYAPTQGVNGIFSVGDVITFSSPDTDVVLDFKKGAPFNPDATPVVYEITVGGSLSKTIVRACFSCTAVATGATSDNENFPTQFDQAQNQTFDCEITLQDGAIEMIFPAGKTLLHVGDSIRFIDKTGKEVTITFPFGAPFDLAMGPYTLVIPANATVTREVKHTCFRAECADAGSAPSGAGLCVPTR